MLKPLSPGSSEHVVYEFGFLTVWPVGGLTTLQLLYIGCMQALHSKCRQSVVHCTEACILNQNKWRSKMGHFSDVKYYITNLELVFYVIQNK